MAATVFNTLETAKKLEQEGFTEKQAVAFVRAMVDAQDELVTKKDLKAELQLLRHELVIKLGSIVIACNAILFVLLRWPH
jgi:CHASE3 domain sensor protein